MKRKIVAGLLCAALTMGSLVGCGASNNTTQESTQSADVSQQETQDNAAAETLDVYYTSDYASKDEALQAGLDLNLQIAKEGMILVKNENETLPLAVSDNADVTVLGYAGINPVAGGSASSGDVSGGVAIAQATVYSSLEDAGYKLNPTVKEFYEKQVSEEKTSDLAIAEDFTAAAETDEWKEALGTYNDAAFVVISGGAGEIGANGRTHALQLDKEQYALIDYAAANFEKVVVLLNSCIPLEVKQIQENENVDAILMIGEGGDNGFAVIGEILCGETSPSGRTTDTWAVDFTKAPSYKNFNTTVNDIGNGVDGAGTLTGYSQYTVNGELVNTWSVGYEEGIYVGYRYYETRSFEENKAGGTEDAWWNDNVTYTFGYGLSYTDFAWEVTPVTAADSVITKDGVLEFDVTVTNKGDYAGKEVVQLYYTAPYGTEATGNENVIEKAHVVLGDYAKTKELAPGESETVRVSIDVADMASYDYTTDKTYVLDKGTYNVKIASCAHYGLSENDADFNYVVEEKTLCSESVGGVEVTNVMDDVTEGMGKYGYTQMTRSDFEGTMPDFSETTKEITAEDYATWEYDDAAYNALYTDIGEVKYETDAANRTSDKYSILLADLVGAEVDDPRYQELVEQLTIEEMVNMVNYGGFNSAAIPYIGKPLSRDTDGPKGWTGNYTDPVNRYNYFVAQPMIAATFNKQLAYDMGVMIGNQGLWGNSTQESGMVYSYTGWYAPGMNIHRSPFDSRYTEYYSEDPVLTGWTAANASLGAKTKGCYISLKHFAFHNDGGGTFTYRCGPGENGTPKDGLSAWMTEQTARELYLRGYQIATEEGEPTFAMGSLTRIGKTWCSGSYAVNQQILRDEWGFEGAVITDIISRLMCNAYQVIKAGGNLMLDATFYGNTTGGYLQTEEILAMDENDKNITIYCLQQATKDVLYMVANSNAMQIPKGAKVVYTGMTEVDGEEIAITLTDAVAGEAYTSAAINNASLNTYYAYSDMVYAVEGLPEGMSYDAAAGVITGTAKEAGEYTITVTVSAAGYESASHDYALIVK